MFSFYRPLYCLRRQRNPGDSWPIVGRMLRSSEDSTIPVELSTQLARSEKTHFGASGHIRSAFAGPSTTDERTRCRGVKSPGNPSWTFHCVPDGSQPGRLQVDLRLAAFFMPRPG
jgi:hypothetical protein